MQTSCNIQIKYKVSFFYWIIYLFYWMVYLKHFGTAAWARDMLKMSFAQTQGDSNENPLISILKD